MNQNDIIARGTKVRTHAMIDNSTDATKKGVDIYGGRRPNANGTIVGIAGGPSGDIYLVLHEGAAYSSQYHYSEIDIADEPPSDAHPLELLLSSYGSMMIGYVSLNAVIAPEILGTGECGYRLAIRIGDVEMAHDTGHTVEDAAREFIKTLRAQGAKI